MSVRLWGAGGLPLLDHNLLNPNPLPHAVFVILFLYFAPDPGGLGLAGTGPLPSRRGSALSPIKSS